MKKMKKIFFLVILLFVALITSNYIYRHLYINKLKKSLNGIIINIGNFASYNEKYVIVDYTKGNQIKNLEEDFNIKNYVSSKNNKLLIVIKKKLDKDKYSNGLAEFNMKTSTLRILDVNNYYFDGCYFNEGIIAYNEKNVVFFDENGEKIDLVKEKEVGFYGCINNNIYYYFPSLGKNIIYIYTKNKEKLTYDENLKDKIWDRDKNEYSKKYSKKDFDIETLNKSRKTNFTKGIVKNEYITKDGKYKIYFKKIQGKFNFRKLTLEIYAENLINKKKLRLFKGAINEYDEGRFENADFENIKNSVYDWFIF